MTASGASGIIPYVFVVAGTTTCLGPGGSFDLKPDNDEGPYWNATMWHPGDSFDDKAYAVRYSVDRMFQARPDGLQRGVAAVFNMSGAPAGEYPESGRSRKAELVWLDSVMTRTVRHLVIEIPVEKFENRNGMTHAAMIDNAIENHEGRASGSGIWMPRHG